VFNLAQHRGRQSPIASARRQTPRQSLFLLGSDGSIIAGSSFTIQASALCTT
jgi:hypothetical protein